MLLSGADYRRQARQQAAQEAPKNSLDKKLEWVVETIAVWDSIQLVRSFFSPNPPKEGVGLAS